MKTDDLLYSKVRHKFWELAASASVLSLPRMRSIVTLLHLLLEQFIQLYLGDDLPKP